ncbi:MAG: head maturation protease, ClpP-related [Dichotomicrobium sp.]
MRNKMLIPVPRLPDGGRVRPRGFSGGRLDIGRDAGGVASAELYGEIGCEGLTSGEMRAWMAEIGGRDVEITVNSIGGDVFEGIAIYNDLVALSGRVTVVVTGIAASAASVVAMAGDHIVIAENAAMMLHNAWVAVEGDHRILAELVPVLEKTSEGMAATYAARSGQPIERVREMMDAETHLAAHEAVELGFADEVRPIAGRGARQTDELLIAGRRRPRGRSDAFLAELGADASARRERRYT